MRALEGRQLWQVRAIDPVEERAEPTEFVAADRFLEKVRDLAVRWLPLAERENY